MRKKRKVSDNRGGNEKVAIVDNGAPVVVKLEAMAEATVVGRGKDDGLPQRKTRGPPRRAALDQRGGSIDARAVQDARARSREGEPTCSFS